MFFQASPTTNPLLRHPAVAAAALPVDLAVPAGQDSDTTTSHKPDNPHTQHKDLQHLHPRRLRLVAVGKSAAAAAVVAEMVVVVDYRRVEIVGVGSGHHCDRCCSDGRRGGRRAGPGSCWGLRSGFYPPG